MTNDPDVTIVVVPMEQFSKFGDLVREHLCRHSAAVQTCVCGGNSPSALGRYFQQQAAALGFKLIRTENYLTSNEARNLDISIWTTAI